MLTREIHILRTVSCLLCLNSSQYDYRMLFITLVQAVPVTLDCSAVSTIGRKHLDCLSFLTGYGSMTGERVVMVGLCVFPNLFPKIIFFSRNFLHRDNLEN